MALWRCRMRMSCGCVCFRWRWTSLSNGVLQNCERREILQSGGRSDAVCVSKTASSGPIDHSLQFPTCLSCDAISGDAISGFVWCHENARFGVSATVISVVWWYDIASGGDLQLRCACVVMADWRGAPLRLPTAPQWPPRWLSFPPERWVAVGKPFRRR